MRDIWTQNQLPIKILFIHLLSQKPYHKKLTKNFDLYLFILKFYKNDFFDYFIIFWILK